MGAMSTLTTACMAALVVIGCAPSQKTDTESPASTYLGGDRIFVGWEHASHPKPKPSEIQSFKIYAVDDYVSDDPCKELRFKLDLQLKGYQLAERLDPVPELFDMVVDPPVPMEEKNIVPYPFRKTLLGLGRPLTITMTAKGRPDMKQTLSKTFSTACDDLAIDGQGARGKPGREGDDANSAKDANGGGDGGDGDKGGIVDAEAAWLEVPGAKRHLLVVARISGVRDDRGNELAPTTTFSVAEEGTKITISARGGKGGYGGDGGDGGCTSGGADGGNGGNGGPGGQINLRVSDKSVLDALELDVRGGDPGLRGKGGEVESGCGRLAPGSDGSPGKREGKPGTAKTKVVPAEELSLVRSLAATNKALKVL